MYKDVYKTDKKETLEELTSNDQINDTDYMKVSKENLVEEIPVAVENTKRRGRPLIATINKDSITSRSDRE